MISRSLQNDLRKARLSSRCEATGGHKYGKVFSRGRFHYKKCKRCKQYQQVVLSSTGEEI